MPHRFRSGQLPGDCWEVCENGAIEGGREVGVRARVSGDGAIAVSSVAIATVNALAPDVSILHVADLVEGNMPADNPA